MERARELGYARSIGVSNFGVRELDVVLAAATIPPVVDQVQFSPFEYRRAVLEHALQRRIAVEAYSPLGTGRHLSNETGRRIASRVGRTPAQVLLRWSLQHALVVIPKSTHRERIEENAQIFDFTLSDQDMAALDTLDRTDGTHRACQHRTCRRSRGCRRPWARGFALRLGLLIEWFCVAGSVIATCRFIDRPLGIRSWHGGNRNADDLA